MILRDILREGGRKTRRTNLYSSSSRCLDKNDEENIVLFSFVARLYNQTTTLISIRRENRKIGNEEEEEDLGHEEE